MEELRNRDGLTEKEFLAKYRPGNYERPSVTVDMLVFTVEDVRPPGRSVPDKVLKLLLIRRKNHPFMNQWAIPGGFVNIDESVDAAAARELKEETSVEDVYLEQLYTWGEVNRDPRMRVISTSYLALVPGEGLKPRAGDDAAEAVWFTVRREQQEETEGLKTWNLFLESRDHSAEIRYRVTEHFTKNGVLMAEETQLLPETRDRLAFDHAKIVNLALERLRNKVEYTPIAFNLLPEEFTLTEAQKVYETLLGRPLFKANFRKKILPMVVETEKKTENVRHRPSQYYRFDPDWRKKNEGF